MTKKPQPELLTNQHPIALCSTTYKMFSIIINHCLTRAMEENGVIEYEQEGRRRNRSTLRQLQRLQWQLHTAQRRGRPIFAVWIDTTNAFASVNHGVIWSILHTYGLSAEDTAFLLSIHRGSFFRVTRQFGLTAL
eukprot:116514-Rhodomonas_salina.1